MSKILDLNRERMLSAQLLYLIVGKYNRLETEEYKHLTVNCFYDFVDPNNRAYIQNIERI